MKLNDVPYYSQKKDVKNSEWKTRACGVVCVKMVLDFYNKDALEIDELIKMGVGMNAYSQAGWVHQGLIDIAKKFGLQMERKEFKSKDFNECEKLFEKGIKEIVQSLDDDGPVLVSVVKEFKYSDKFHMIVLAGYKGDNKNPAGFYYNDPDTCTETEGKNLFVSLEIFEKYWRKMAIFIHQ